jgi:hypothetical protein
MKGLVERCAEAWRRALVVLLLCLGSVGTAFAHGFGQRYDLPVPLWLYVAGAAAAVAFSFVVVGVFVRGTARSHVYPRLNLLRFPIGRLLAHAVCLVSLKLIAVVFFVLLILTGLLGNPHPMRNLAPTLLWIVWWVGLAYVSALGGNLWAVINPLKTLFAWAESLYRRIHPAGELTLSLRYPSALGKWPGVLLFLAFAWVELVFEGSAVPANLAIMALIYAGITWIGMFLFGREQWLQYGEAFSLAFGILARFAPTEVRVVDPSVCQVCPLDCRDQDGECIDCYACSRQAAPSQREWNLRPFASGLLRNQAISISEMTFVLLLLATVTFDGFEATPLWVQIETMLSGLLPDFSGAHLLIRTLGLIAFPALFLGLYCFFGWAMAITSGRRLPAGVLARCFVFTLVPIAIAYHMAHYFSFLLIQGQFIIPLLSDPFGFGWNVLGTAGYRPNPGLVGARFAWFTAVMAIVIGHIIAVYLAHLVAVRTLRDRLLALYSQYPMLVLMVGYTMVSLWILAQPIVERSVSPPVAAEASSSAGIELPPEALLPELGSGVLREVGQGHTAEAKITYRLLTSTFHDGTRMTVADLLYPYIFAYRWGVREAPDEPAYDPYVARVTALIRERLVGFRVLRVDRSELGIGQLRLVREMPVLEVYVNHVAADPAQVAALAPPWSSLPWHLLVLMEEAVQQGWAAFSAEAAQRRGVKWLDLVRDPRLKGRLALLVENFVRQRYVPEVLRRFVAVDEAQKRWMALQKFYQTRGHFLVTNGPYRLDAWSEEATVLQVFRDMSYPLGVGSYDRYAIPHRAYVSAITVRGGAVEIRADVERVEKFLRTYEIVREPLRGAAPNKNALPLCRFVVVGADGTVLRTGTAVYRGDGVFLVDLPKKLPPGRYLIMVALYLNENYVNPEVKVIRYRVSG